MLSFLKKFKTKKTKRKCSKIEYSNKVIAIQSKQNGKLLVCDDSQGNRMVLKRYFDKINVKVDESINGEAAISMIEKNGKYDIVWMDIQMPKMNGYECVEALRKSGYTGIIIGLTGYIDAESVNKGLETGMNHVIGKPINKDTLYTYYNLYKKKD